MTKRAKQTEDKYVLRLPDGMRARLKESAALSKRSMNAEIIKRLEETYQFQQAAFDFNTGEQAADRPESWFRKRAYAAMDEKEIMKAIVAYGEELSLAIKALNDLREYLGED